MNVSVKAQVNFKPLSVDEAKRKLSTLALIKGEIVLWIKGSKSRDYLKVTLFDATRMRLFIDEFSLTVATSGPVFYSFDLNGMSFFGKGDLADSGRELNLRIVDEIYKSERRTNFRLLTHPNYQVYSFFDIQETYPGSNVAEIHTKIRQTELFKNFLNLVNESEINESTLVFRVHDISVTGLSFIISPAEKNYFEVGKEFINLKLNINGENLVIPRCKIRYVKNNGSSPTGEQKVGAEFINLPIRIDNFLGSKINSLLRDFEDRSAFEKFLK